MKDALAERLLATVMNWDAQDIARERPILQALAILKYDSYQQFSPGLRFVESLALWLHQFNEIEERKAAYDFVCRNLIYLAPAEMSHFAAIAYPDYVRPHLMRKVADKEGLKDHQVKRILETETFQKSQSTALFVGLSDGARIDLFRRANRDLSHEQIFQSYDLPNSKLQELSTRLDEITPGQPTSLLVLLDDFAGSGKSYFREEAGVTKGKVAKLLSRLIKDEHWQKLVRLPDTAVILLLYCATDKAIKEIERLAGQLLTTDASCFRLEVVQRIPDSICIRKGGPEPIVALAEKYYDSSLEDEHTRKGGEDLKFGFAACGLPLVLHHNAPNNAIFLLWAEETCSVRALFPRISRHRSEA